MSLIEYGVPIIETMRKIDHVRNHMGHTEKINELVDHISQPNVYISLDGVGVYNMDTPDKIQMATWSNPEDHYIYSDSTYNSKDFFKWNESKKTITLTQTGGYLITASIKYNKPSAGITVLSNSDSQNAFSYGQTSYIPEVGQYDLFEMQFSYLLRINDGEEKDVDIFVKNKSGITNFQNSSSRLIVVRI